MSYGTLDDMTEVITGPCCPEECRDLCARKNVKLTLAE
jgi:hypothetical protein